MNGKIQKTSFHLYPGQRNLTYPETSLLSAPLVTLFVLDYYTVKRTSLAGWRCTAIFEKGGVMIYLRLLQLIEDNADELTRRLCKDLLSREETKGYRGLSENLIRERVYDVYSKLGSWLGTDKHTSGEVRRVYTELGRKRQREGIPLHEVVLAFMLIKRHLWLYVLEKQFFDSSFEMHQALEFNNRVVLFFDRAIYFSAMGYERELRKETGKHEAGVLSRIFKK